MKIAVLKERAALENRVALTPDIVKKLTSKNVRVYVEQGAGERAFFSDEQYINAGAQISNVLLEIVADADVVVKVQPSPLDVQLTELNFIGKNSCLIGLFNPYQNKNLISVYAEKYVNCFAMELLPRITKAQSMDVLSSQSNIAGYAAVMTAAYEYSSLFPMLMTAAGTITPAKVLVMGAGVAGLQAIATAKRLGAVMSAFDVRSAAKEQVQSLGAKFIEIDQNQQFSQAGVYAKELSEEQKAKQQDVLAEYVKKSDIIITTALIPGKPAPILINEEMLKTMRSGSLIIDIAAANGGNCVATIADQTNFFNNVRIIGLSNPATKFPTESSKLYAKNIYNFLEHVFTQEFKFSDLPLDDEIVKACLLTYQGNIVHSNFKA